MFNRTISVAAIALGVTACSQRQGLMTERARTVPPQNAQDVGIILDGVESNQVLDVLEKNPKARVRVLNQEHGLYEIFGVKQDDLKVTGSAAPNQFFDFHATHKKRLDLFSVPGPAGLQVPGLNPCADAPNGPTAVTTAESPTGLADGVTIELGKKVKVNAKQSLNTAGATAALKTVIAVAYPDASPTPQAVNSVDTFEFTPDTMGLYQIVVIVQDGNNACALDGMRFIVTANRPYEGKKTPTAKLDLTKFKHLAALNADKAQQISQGDNVVIAIIDSGVDYNQPYLASNILTNDKEIPNNGIDDDKNGLVDDYVGYDFANQDPFPYDDDSHGTHVAGLAAGLQIGMAPHAKILPVKAMTPAGGDIGTIAAAIRYAVDRKANIINMSLGAATPQPHPALVSAMDYAKSKGVLVVVAAGNGDDQGVGYSIDDSPVFPASLKSDNMISVAASAEGEELTKYSNFGIKTVHVVAPGGDMPNDPMYSTAFENVRNANFIGMTGTSMATPVVAGIAADVMAANPRLQLKDVKDILMKAGTPSSVLTTKAISGRHIDALSAVSAAVNANVLF